RRRHTISKRDWSSDVCSSDLARRFSSSAWPCCMSSGAYFNQDSLVAEWICSASSSKGAIWAYTSSPNIAPSDSLRDFFFDNIHMITHNISHAPSIKYSAGQTGEAPVPGTIAHTMTSRAPIPPIAGSQLNLETYGRSIFG